MLFDEINYAAQLENAGVHAAFGEISRPCLLRGRFDIVSEDIPQTGLFQADEPIPTWSINPFWMHVRID